MYKKILVNCHIPDDIKNYFEDTFVGKETRNSTKTKIAIRHGNVQRLLQDH